MPLRDSMISAAADYNMLDDMIPSDGTHMPALHMGHRHMGFRHKCLYRQVYRWLCHHKESIRTALIIELILCTLFAATHLIWSCCLKTRSLEGLESDAGLKAPLIESAAYYTADDHKTVISPLWAHVMGSKSEVSVV